MNDVVNIEPTEAIENNIPGPSDLSVNAQLLGDQGNNELINENLQDGSALEEPFQYNHDNILALSEPPIPVNSNSAIYSNMEVNQNKNVKASNGRFVCNECHKTYSRNDALTRHSQLHSSTPKPFKCDYCGENFSRKDNLTTHINRHMEHKPYVCNRCGRGFVERRLLLAHMRSEQNDRPFVCSHDGCQKRFVTLKLMKQHQRIHNSEKRFKCVQCSYSSHRNENFKKHIARIHGASQNQAE